MGGGWLVGVKRGLSGLQLDAALDLARYLASPENANRLRAEATFPMLPVRSSQMGHGLPDPTSAPDVDSRQWSDAVSRTLMAGRVVPGLRIPEAAGYLEDLARARVAALDGKDPETVLRKVFQAWAARTKARGSQASSGTTVAASTAWPHFPNLPSMGNERILDFRFWNVEFALSSGICHLPSILPHSEIWPLTSGIPLVVDGTKTR